MKNNRRKQAIMLKTPIFNIIYPNFQTLRWPNTYYKTATDLKTNTNKRLKELKREPHRLFKNKMCQE